MNTILVFYIISLTVIVCSSLFQGLQVNPKFLKQPYTLRFINFNMIAMLKLVNPIVYFKQSQYHYHHSTSPQR